MSLQLISGCSFFISHTFHSSVYYERKDVPGITIELLGATILFHLSKKKKKQTVNNNDFVQPLSSSHQHVSSWYKSQAINAPSKPRIQFNARITVGKKSILATEIAILNAIKQNWCPSYPSLYLAECTLSCQRKYKDKHSILWDDLIIAKKQS